MLLLFASFGARPATATHPTKTERDARIETKKKKLESADWIKLALNLTGDSPEIESQAKKDLKKIPNLRELLKAQIPGGPYQGLALDVIVTLDLKDFFPHLVQASEKDEDGFIVLAINSLIDDKNAQFLADTYLKRLADTHSALRASAPARVAMLDTLERLHVFVGAELFPSLLDDESHEVRLMALRSLRSELLSQKQEALLPLLQQSLRAKPFQLRTAALFLWKDIPIELKNKSLLYLEPVCESDPNTLVKKLCESSRAEFSKGTQR